MANRKRSAVRHEDPIVVQAAKAVFAQSGAWATKQLKAALMNGGALRAAALRTADTLKRDEWKVYDNAVLEESKIRLVGVQDLIKAGLVVNVPNALGKLVFGYEKMTDMDEAEVSLDGLSRSANDTLEFDLNQLPLPITHKDFFINLRKLAASRNGTEAIDTTNVRVATRIVAQAQEKMLFQGGRSFGKLPIYGYTTEPNRNTDTFDGTKNWEDDTKTGPSFLKDVQSMIGMANSDRHYGPFQIYVPTGAGVLLDGDYNVGSANNASIRQRLLQIEGVAGIKVADQLPTGNVVMVQQSADVVEWISGEQIQTVQWDEAGGFKINFKVFAIAVPLIRSDIAGRSGISHLHA